MDDYIKRSEAFNVIVSEMQSRGERTNFREAIVRQAIASIPAADVRENVRGKWICTKVRALKDGEWAICSCCGSAEHVEYYGELTWKFCPECGADMRGVEK